MGEGIVLLIFISFEFVYKYFEGSGKPQSPQCLKWTLSEKETVQMSLCFFGLPCSFVALLRGLVGVKKTNKQTTNKPTKTPKKQKPPKQ